jgi:hypothetical protein
LSLSAVSFINEGTLLVTDSLIVNQSGRFSIRNMVNEGTIEISGGELALYHDWSNNGSISMSAGELTLAGSIQGPTFGDPIDFTSLESLQKIGGRINIGGRIENTDSEFILDSTLGDLGLTLSGTIIDGSITTPDGTKLVIGAQRTGRLEGVHLLTDAIIEPQGRLIISENLTFDGTITMQSSSTNTRALLDISGDHSLLGQGTVLFDALEDNLNLNGIAPGTGTDSTLTIGPDVTVMTGTGGGIVGSPFNLAVNFNRSVANQGAIIANHSLGEIVVTGISVSNTGLFEAIDGGTISVNALTSNPGTISAGNGGRVIVESDLPLEATSQIQIGILGTDTGTIGRIEVTGDAVLAGELTITFAEGMVLNSGDTYEIMSYASQTGTFSAMNFVNAGGAVVETEIGESQISLRIP